jgi:hypothetical protein
MGRGHGLAPGRGERATTMGEVLFRAGYSSSVVGRLAADAPEAIHTRSLHCQ